MQPLSPRTRTLTRKARETFRKRKKTLLKNCNILEQTCDAKVYLLIYRNGKHFTYTTNVNDYDLPWPRTQEHLKHVYPKVQVITSDNFALLYEHDDREEMEDGEIKVEEETECKTRCAANRLCNADDDAFGTMQLDPAIDPQLLYGTQASRDDGESVRKGDIAREEEIYDIVKDEDFDMFMRFQDELDAEKDLDAAWGVARTAIAPAPNDGGIWTEKKRSASEDGVLVLPKVKKLRW